MKRPSWKKPEVRMFMAPTVYNGSKNGHEIVCKVTPYGLGEKEIRVKITGLEAFSAGKDGEIPAHTSFGYALRKWVQEQVKLQAQTDYIGNSAPREVQTPGEVY